jgi:septum formation protein
VTPRLTLASASPRRSELLRAAGFDFEVRPGGVVEAPWSGGDPGEYAESLARAKAASVAGELVVGADTVVVVDGRVLGKPAGPDDAAAMLRLLSGRDHEVITAVALNRGGALRWASARARVTFRKLDPDEIAAYVASGEPLDKAGGYAIQGGAAGFVVGLEGERDTVIGLPIGVLRRLLAMVAAHEA